MRFRNVPTDDVATALVNILFFANDFDASPAAGCCRFQYVHILEIRYLPIKLKSLIVFWKNVSRRCNVIALAVEPAHPLDVFPHLVLTTEAPTACKMVNFLTAI